MVKVWRFLLVVASSDFGRTSFLYWKMRLRMKEEDNLTITGQEAGFLAGMQKADSIMNSDLAVANMAKANFKRFAN